MTQLPNCPACMTWSVKPFFTHIFWVASLFALFVLLNFVKSKNKDTLLMVSIHSSLMLLRFNTYRPCGDLLRFFLKKCCRRLHRKQQRLNPFSWLYDNRWSALLYDNVGSLVFTRDVWVIVFVYSRLRKVFSSLTKTFSDCIRMALF